MSRRLKYATFCSGIECMSVACRGLPLDPVFFSEIEPFPCAVLAAHYPDIPNLGDMSKIRRDEKGDITNGRTTIPFPDGGIDILAAGCPCQDFSVAGKRAGGEEGSGTRSSLIFEFIRIVGEVRPRWFIYENVVGMLSTNEGRDFAHILLAFRDCGYSVCWRTLDAQYVRVDGMERAVPQRRRRVWVVGCLGADESVPAQILFEPDCVAGHTPPRRRAGKGFAYSLAGRDRVDAGVVGEPAADRDGGCLNPLDPQSKRLFMPDGVMQTLGAQAENTWQNTPGVCIALDGDNLKPREDPRKGGNGFGINEEGAGYTLTGVDRHGVAYGIDQQGGKGGANTTEGVAPTVLSDSHGTPHGVAYETQAYENHAQDSRVQGPIDTAPTQGSSNANSAGVSGNNPLVCFSKVSHPTAPNGEKRCQEVVVSMAQNTRDEVRIVGGDGQIAGALPAEPGMKQQTYVVSTQGLDGYNNTLTGDCAPTISGAACDLHHTHGVISTNSNGEDVAATLTCDLAKQTGAQQQNGGGYVLVRREDSALTDSGSTETGR